MSWIRSAFQVSIPLLITIVLVDAIAYLGFREQIQTILPGYGVTISNFDRGYPRYHFQPDETLGFDIRPDFKTETSTKPAEYKAYDVWGNSFGCFDDEWTPADRKSGIYLAGDSFMWGYVSYDKKAGTLLQEELALPVYECGVTHTGQIHQFEKFSRLFQAGVTPEVVIVNVSVNDINNDFFFPHSTVVEGYMVETVEQCGYHDHGTYSFSKISTQEAQEVVEEKIGAPTTLKSALRDYSLIANVAVQLIRAGPSLLGRNGIGGDGDATEGRPDTATECRTWLYGGAYEALGEEYLNSELSGPNREAITRWIRHASTHGYEILFSLIPAKSQHAPNYPFIKRHIEMQAGRVIDFEDYIESKDLQRKTLYYEQDEHFNEAGNAYYARFLAEEIAALMN